MLDSHLAELYQVETRKINQAVKRNKARFPNWLSFKLTKEELAVSRSQFVILKNEQRGHNIKYLPTVFTEQGVAMLSAVLKSDVAIHMSLNIMEAFVQLRKTGVIISRLEQRVEHVEEKQKETGQKIDQLFSALEKANPMPQQGIFYNGQIFDAYHFAADLIKRANHSILLIDNYVDEVTLALLSKRKKKVEVVIYSGNASPMLETDVKKWTSQYGPIQFRTLKNNHDRFLIIDNQALYHLGASLKDLGHKLFAFSRMDQELERLMATL